jgi:hypothetical protein
MDTYIHTIKEVDKEGKEGVKYKKMTLGSIILLTYLNPCGSIGYDEK